MKIDDKDLPKDKNLNKQETIKKQESVGAEPPPPPINGLTLKQAGKQLGKSHASMKFYAKQGRIPGAVKVGWWWLTPAEPVILPVAKGRPPNWLRKQRGEVE